MVEDVVEGKRIPRFLIFDVLAFNGYPDGKELDFDKRLELILREIILPRHRAMECAAIDRSREPFGIRRKDFYGLKHSKHLFNEKFKREVPHETDGLIFQPVYMPYIFGTFYELLKYKPPQLNSVDFKLVISGHVMEKRKIGSGGFLYVRKYNEPFARIRLTAQLFLCNEKIIECVVEGGDWKMIRVRNDKDIANTFQTAMAIKESIERLGEGETKEFEVSDQQAYQLTLSDRRIFFFPDQLFPFMKKCYLMICNKLAITTLSGKKARPVHIDHCTVIKKNSQLVETSLYVNEDLILERYLSIVNGPLIIGLLIGVHEKSIH
ncbi:hypothetical protein ACOME3_010455 [Neoechinorhynchus agilis]